MAKYKKRSDGRYLIQVQIGIQDNGKPKYKNIYAHTIKELEEKASAFRQELERGIVVDDKGLTVDIWARKWLELYKGNKEYYTIEMYKSVINVHISPALGRFKLSELKAHHIQEMINQKAAQGLTRTLEKIKLTLNQILEQAVKNELIYKNVMVSIEMPTKEKVRKRILTEQEKKYISNADFNIKEKAFVNMLLFTGLRRGEILALTKTDVDLKAKAVTINKDVIFKGNQPEIKNSPKTDSGNRTIPIVDELIAILGEYIPTIDSIYVFPSSNQTVMTQNVYRCFWANIIKKINIAAGGTNGKLSVKAISNDITPHMFRHTYATMLYYAGIDIKTAQYLLGHASIQVTMDIYTHLDIEKNHLTINKLNDFLSTESIKAMGI